jgi:hypothetical protein
VDERRNSPDRYQQRIQRYLCAERADPAKLQHCRNAYANRGNHGKQGNDWILGYSPGEPFNIHIEYKPEHL